jgi:predicted NBD/HSP70 family sugar kinase
MQKISTMRTSGKNIFQGQLTIGLDLGDRSSAYCVLNEAGEIVLEHKLATTPEAMKQVSVACRGVASRWRRERILRG